MPQCGPYTAYGYFVINILPVCFAPKNMIAIFVSVLFTILDHKFAFGNIFFNSLARRKSVGGKNGQTVS